jgi:hypothetical protein
VGDADRRQRIGAAGAAAEKLAQREADRRKRRPHRERKRPPMTSAHLHHQHRRGDDGQAVAKSLEHPGRRQRGERAGVAAREARAGLQREPENGHALRAQAVGSQAEKRPRERARQHHCRDEEAGRAQRHVQIRCETIDVRHELADRGRRGDRRSEHDQEARERGHARAW